jgi:mono/diheme cytochrome c family protein/outer membrane lipoprotein SlyB
VRRVWKVLRFVGVALGLLVVGVAGFAGWNAVAYDRSIAEVRRIPLPHIERSTDPVVLARGAHLAGSLGGCALGDCHGSDLGGGKVSDAGPLGTFVAPNITSGGRGAEYSDGEMARLILHGIKRDGRGVRLMSSSETAWLPDADFQAIVSFVRSVPPVSRPSREIEIGIVGKVLDRLDFVQFDAARRIDHVHRRTAPDPAPTAAYGAYIAGMCRGCHGASLSGGPIPGAPPDLAVPRNLTPHRTGLGGWTFDDFVAEMRTGVRRDGKRLDAFMPREALNAMNDTERRALWAYLQTVPPLPFGNR